MAMDLYPINNNDYTLNPYRKDAILLLQGMIVTTPKKEKEQGACKILL